MSDSKSNSHTHESHSIKGYLFVYFALLVGTLLTVWASYLDLGHSGNIALALVIASVKAFLVIAYFMHLISEKKMIFSILGFTVFFVVGLVVLTLCSMHNFPKFTVTH